MRDDQTTQPVGVLAVFDFSATVKNLNGDVELLKEVVELFVDDAPNQLQALETAIQEGDANAIEHNAHTLKGSSSCVGAEKMRQQASQLEILGQYANFDASAKRFDALQTSFEELKIAVHDVDWSTLNT